MEGMVCLCCLVINGVQAGRVLGKRNVKRVTPLQPVQCHSFPNLPCISMRDFIIIFNWLPSPVSLSLCQGEENTRRCWSGLDLMFFHHLGFGFLPCSVPQEAPPWGGKSLIFGDFQGNLCLTGISHWECALSPLQAGGCLFHGPLGQSDINTDSFCA